MYDANILRTKTFLNVLNLFITSFLKLLLLLLIFFSIILLLFHNFINLFFFTSPTFFSNILTTDIPSSLLLGSSLFEYIYYYYYSFYSFFYDTIFFLGFFNYFFFFDNITFVFLLITSFLSFFCLYYTWYNSFEKTFFMFFLLLLINFMLYTIFLTTDLLIFYIAFESLLIPMIFVIGFFGSRTRKVFANLYFFFYTYCGSLFLLLGILYLYSKYGTFDYLLLRSFIFSSNLLFRLSLNEEIFLWFCFFISFAIKFPLFPFHLWLPEAHVEAPTVGSVILAGILLKLGGYGIFRYVLFLFPLASLFLQKFVFLISILGLTFSAFTALRQIDLKRIIAYASISHMHFVMFGLFSFNYTALLGSLFLMISHSFVAAGLFFLVGYLYEYYGSRLIFYYNGLYRCMPFFCVTFFIYLLANLGFPGTSGFIGEFLILISFVTESLYLSFFFFFCIFLNGVYSLWLYTRISFGTLNYFYILHYADISDTSKILFNFFSFLIFLLGIFPDLIFLFIEKSCFFFMLMPLFI
ncbi:MAG: NADH-quinone oxidoreductase subunit M [Pyrinomonadaceae bacterium]|nr:NADH-quinone oxidoreductase subunit M [Pyrinomonadaceae bacterium]